MHIKLGNVLAFVKKKFNDLHIVFDEPPTFLRSIINSNEKVIFICKMKQTKVFSYISPKREIKSENSLDLTGSPLKDDCNIDSLNISMDLPQRILTPWLKHEENYQPIELEKVRAIISDSSFQEEARKTSSYGSVWFLCKATESDNTVLMSLNFDDNYNSISFIKSCEMVETNSLNFDKLIKIHNSYIKGVKHCDTFIENCYNIENKIYLKLSWSTSAARPQLNNIKNCTTMLCQEIDLENNDSVFQHFWRQLCILDLINEDVVNFKTNDQIGNETVCKWGRGIELDVLKENIIEVMTELPGYYCNNENDSKEIEPVAARSRTRPLCDITDKLFEILKCCSSYKDLKIGFVQVFQCAAQRNIINMPVNENCLAKIIREVAQRRLAIPCLTGTEPLELLLEIGLEKLQKDYEYILIESKICGLTDLQRLQNSEECNKVQEQNFNVRNTLSNAHQKFQANKKTRKTLLHNLQNARISDDDSVNIIGFQNSKYNEKEAELKLAKLCQIHVALEHLLSIQLNLNLENVYNQIFEQLLQRPLQPFPRDVTKFSDSIALPILTDNIVVHVENKVPHVRRIVIKSSNQFRKVETSFYYNKDNVFPSNVLSSIADILDEKPSKNCEMYFNSMYVCIRTRRS
ncbi:protein zwilch isoform X2 [Condylostylus longicornis]|uniref:protein zwilch isoform X2 n=1 Tax=Condylostylus longicornis TaxID=2530218 RepID=UPI00244E22F9|nr:protein zwilch isoform X2 [Condylostylus longicornis]